MITPSELIADLDEALAEAGEDVVLRRLTLGPNGAQIPFDCNCRASVRPVKAEELVGAIDQSALKVVLSPTDIDRAQWPLPIRKGDKLVIAGAVKNVEFPKHIRAQNRIVRLELLVKG